MLFIARCAWAIEELPVVEPARNAGPPVFHECNALAFSGDSRLLATAGITGEIKVWETGDWSLKSVLQQPGSVDQLAFSPDRKYLYVGGGTEPSILVRFKLESCQEDRTYHGPKQGVSGLWLSLDGNQMVTSSYRDRRVLVWDTESGRPVKSFDLDAYCDALDVSPDGKRLARKSAGRGVVTLSALDGQARDSMLVFKQGVRTLRFVGDSTRAVVAAGGFIPGKPPTHIAVGDFKNELKILAQRDTSPDHVMTMATSSDARYLAIGFGDGQVAIFSVDSLEEVRRFDWSSSFERAYSTSLKLSPDGRLLACAMSLSTPHLVDMATLEEIKTGTGHNADIVSVFFVNEGDRLRSIGRDESVCLWDASTMKLLKKVQLPEGYVCVGARSVDGAYLICASRDQFKGPFGESKAAAPPVKVVNADTGECVAEVKLPPVFWRGRHNIQWLGTSEALLLADGAWHRFNYLTGTMLDTRAIDIERQNALYNCRGLATEDAKSLFVIDGGGKSSSIEVQIVDISTRTTKPVGKTNLPRGSHSGGLVPDNKHFYMTGEGIYIFERATLKLAASNELKDRNVLAVAFNAVGSRYAVVTGGLPRSGSDLTARNPQTETAVRIYETFSGKMLFAFPVATRWVRDVKLSPTGDRLAIARDDGVIDVWELPNLQLGQPNN